MRGDLNRFQCVGRLGQDPELRYTPAGSAVVNLSIATSHKYKVEGEQREETTWVRFALWNKQAEIAAEYLKKGSRLYIEGRLREVTWDDTKTGEKHRRMEVVCDDFQMLDSKPSGARPEPEADAYTARQQAGGARPATASPVARPVPARPVSRPVAATTEDDMDDTLPF